MQTGHSPIYRQENIIFLFKDVYCGAESTGNKCFRVGKYHIILGRYNSNFKIYLKYIIYHLQSKWWRYRTPVIRFITFYKLRFYFQQKWWKYTVK